MSAAEVKLATELVKYLSADWPLHLEIVDLTGLVSDEASPVNALLVEVERLRGQVAQAWDEGYASGASNVRRQWSDEPDLIPTRNPYLPVIGPPT